jgi:hypothetical protein
LPSSSNVFRKVSRLPPSPVAEDELQRCPGRALAVDLGREPGREMRRLGGVLELFISIHVLLLPGFSVGGGHGVQMPLAQLQSRLPYLTVRG